MYMCIYIYILWIESSLARKCCHWLGSHCPNSYPFLSLYRDFGCSYFPLNPLGPAGVNRDSLYPFLSRTTEWLVWTTIDHQLRAPLQLHSPHFIELWYSLPHSQQSTTCPYPNQINPLLCPSQFWRAQFVSFLVGLRTYQHPSSLGASSRHMMPALPSDAPCN